MTAMAADDLESTDVTRLVRRPAEGNLHAWNDWSISTPAHLVDYRRIQAGGE